MAWLGFEGSKFCVDFPSHPRLPPLFLGGLGVSIFLRDGGRRGGRAGFGSVQFFWELDEGRGGRICCTIMALHFPGPFLSFLLLVHI